MTYFGFLVLESKWMMYCAAPLLSDTLYRNVQWSFEQKDPVLAVLSPVQGMISLDDEDVLVLAVVAMAVAPDATITNAARL